MGEIPFDPSIAGLHEEELRISELKKEKLGSAEKPAPTPDWVMWPTPKRETEPVKYSIPPRKGTVEYEAEAEERSRKIGVIPERRDQ